MNSAADLAFYQNFYNGASLYLVPDASQVASPAVPAVAREEQANTAPITASAVVAAPEPAATAPPVVVPAPVPPLAPVAAAAPPAGKLPSLANLGLAATSTPVPPAVAPQAPPVQALLAAPAATVRELVTPSLAQLPAAAAAPAGRVQPTPTQSPVAHIPFSTLGSNPNGLIILVRLPEDAFRKLPRNVFLNNILKAIRLIVEDVVLVNVEHPTYPVALCSLRQHLAAKQFLAFGKNLLDVAVYTTQPYEPVLLFGDTAFLGASEVSMLEYDAGRKKQLWQAMQRMFL
ncbi:hypothetical protein [Hymenobacter mucosus]|uniref:Uncharacterized protein n=1 Tax=Hymenobacter mucosus TaxID=1411120 RepID=A0A238V481_9BACT|nr:hypothetical protein [Hymenobacter mucosus]SNR29275.1 hypothetical protein SAMN06269173_101117 [Hymenobacter mucosus]